MLVLYGLGTTVGAGIYVLVGAAAGRAGYQAPLAFIVAAIAMMPTAATYGELSGRYPLSAGEAAYVEAGFRARSMAIFIGCLVIVSGLVASATIAIGCAGYLRTFIDIPAWLGVLGVIGLMGGVAIAGITQSVVLAAAFTLLEVGGLLVVIVWGFSSGAVTVDAASRIVAVSDLPGALGVGSASLLAVFAFIGFEDLVNVAEETKEPARTMPPAILATLALTTVLYALVALVAVSVVEPAQLAMSEAPLSTVFETLTGRSPLILSAIAIFATANTILVQLIMVSRVGYGLARDGNLPKVLARVNPRTRTPIVATGITLGASAVLALAFDLEGLAEFSAQMVLAIWILTNVALVLIKLRKEPAPEGVREVSIAFPIAGAVLGGLLVVISLTT